jgi:hypothetical protein
MDDNIKEEKEKQMAIKEESNKEHHQESIEINHSTKPETNWDSESHKRRKGLRQGLEKPDRRKYKN